MATAAAAVAAADHLQMVCNSWAGQRLQLPNAAMPDGSGLIADRLLLIAFNGVAQHRTESCCLLCKGRGSGANGTRSKELRRPRAIDAGTLSRLPRL